MKTQSDEVFSIRNFDYETLVNPEKRFFYYKTWKYQIKHKAKPFLKIKLIEPPIVSILEKKTKTNSGVHHFRQNQLLLSPGHAQHTQNWQNASSASPEVMRSSSNGKRTISPLNFLSFNNVGRNIKNSLRAIIPGSKNIPQLMNAKPGKKKKFKIQISSINIFFFNHI